MPTPLKISFTAEMPDAVLERATLLGVAAGAAKAFSSTMEAAGYDVAVVAEEIDTPKRGRKPRADKGATRTKPSLAEAA
jgi:hypothetical protein